MIGTTLDRYSVEAELGAGGMATVYRVRHLTLGSLHALKVLKVQSASIRQRLVQEGRVQATLRHPNIVAVTDVIDVDGAPGLVMEFIDGPSLEGWLEENRPSLAQSEAIFRGILAGVARAHRQGLVHRDLKPGNVLLDSSGDDGIVPKVADFGLAKILDDEEGFGSQTRSGIAMGTPAYMAPEQVRSAKNVDQRADIFALGCILYELVGGDRPFHGDDLLETMTAVCSGEYTPLPPDVPQRVRDTVAACLVVDRERRVADCAGIRALLSGESRSGGGVRTPEISAPLAPQGLQSAVPALAMSPVPMPLEVASAEPRSRTFAADSAASLVLPAPEIPERDFDSPATALPARRGWWPWLVGLGAGGVLAVAAGVLVVGLVWFVASPAPSPSVADGVVDPSSAPAGTALGPSGDDHQVVEVESTQASTSVLAEPVTTPSTAAPSVTPSSATTATDAGAVATGSEGTAPTTRASPSTSRDVGEAASLPGGIVSLVGDSAKVRFVGDAGTFPPGQVPAGKYTIRAQFPGQGAISAGSVTIREGVMTTISCNEEFQMCRVK